MRIRSPISYISRTLPLAISWRSATVGMSRRLAAAPAVAGAARTRPLTGGFGIACAMPATDPAQMHGLFEEAFNAGHLDALMALYEPDAALVPQPGSVAEGTAAIRESLTWFLDRRGPSALHTTPGL